MADALVLFPHQLFEDNRRLAKGRQVFLVEDALYFRQYRFHQQKLVLHRASMRAHETMLRSAGGAVTYLDTASAPDMAATVRQVLAARPDEVHYLDPVDDWLERRLLRELKKAGARAQKHPTPMFLSDEAFLDEQFGGKKRFYMARFYQAQRRRLGILMDKGEPAGGQWSFDAENRKRLPKGIALPPLPWPSRSEAVAAAIESVSRDFGTNPGRATDFRYPTTSAEARAWLRDFVAHRLPSFGDYEDAIAADEPFLFHSVLTPMLNTGLLTPGDVVDAALGAPGIPINALEGFVRQVIGWREFMRAAYVYAGRRQRTTNFWNHTRPLPRAFLEGRTGLPPLDAVVRRVERHAYAHHIERLMVVSNFSLLAGFSPDALYEWFMANFIDAYDWVMVPNVYGMAMHADGGLITTKPYVGGSNYLLKMSDFKRGDWCADWDALFWTFIADHRDFFDRNPRLGMMVRQLDKMDEAKRAGLASRARDVVARLGR